MPWVGGLKYHGYGGRYTMGKGFDIPCVGGQNNMNRGVKYHGYNSK
jgi:hypothetical protein